MPDSTRKNVRAVGPIDRVISRNLRRVRTEKGVSQEDLAEALGVTFQQIQKYEKATNRIASSRLIEIASHLDVSLAELLAGTGGRSKAAAGAERLFMLYRRLSARDRARLLDMAENLAAGSDA